MYALQNKSRPWWVTFDFDHTLIKSPYWRLHFLPWLTRQAHHQNVDATILRRAIHDEGQRRWARGEWVASFDWSAIAQTLGLDPIPPADQPDATTVRNLVLPHVETVLWSLKRLDVRLAVVTNGFKAFQSPYLKALGWDYVFDAIVTPDIIGTAKPDPAMMKSLHPILLHIGDRLTHDVLCAQRAGAGSALVDSTMPETDRIDPLSPSHIVPDFLIHDFRVIPSIVSTLLNTRNMATVFFT